MTPMKLWRSWSSQTIRGESMARRHKFKRSLLTERWELERFDYVVAGFCYRGKRVFTVIAKNKEDALESMAAFKENSCED